MSKQQVPFQPDNLKQYPVDHPRARVAIWVGHSDEDEGAESPRTGLTEYDYNTPVADAVALHLQEHGIHVDVYRRDLWGEFVDMRRVTNMRHYSAGRYDLGISLHLNCYNEKASGTEVLYWHKSKQGRLLASQLITPITELFDLPSRGVKPLYKGDRAWFIVGKTAPVWCIIEGAFIDNPKDEAALVAHQDLYDEAITDGILSYLSISRDLVPF